MSMNIDYCLKLRNRRYNGRCKQHVFKLSLVDLCSKYKYQINMLLIFDLLCADQNV